MRTVVLETSSSHGQLAIADGCEILATREMPHARRHARDLVVLLKEMVDAYGWPPAEIELVVVGVGPGSYTGLRVGVTAAKTLAYASGATVVAPDSMSVLAEGSPPEALDIRTVVDAQQEHVYTACFRRTAGDAVPTMDGCIEIRTADEWLASLQPGAYITGPALIHLERRLPSTCDCAPPQDREPALESLWRIGMRLFHRGRRDDFWMLEPLYLRPSAAEQKRAARDICEKEVPPHE